MTTVAVLGTGLMGAGMARSLLREGCTVRAWNRSVDKAKPLEQDGATVHEDPAEAVAGADVVLTMLFDADAVESVVSKVLPAMADDAVWVQSSTVGLEAAERLARAAEERGIGFVDAPVLGTRAPAEKGQLVVLAAAPERVRPSAQPVLDAIGAKVIWVGDRPGDGHRLKLVANSWVLSVVGATAQAVSLARGLDIDPQLFLDAIDGQVTDCAYARMKAKAMLDGDFSPSFGLSGALKDAGLISEAMRSAGVDDSLMAALRDRFAAADRDGHGGEDMAAVVTAMGG